MWKNKGSIIKGPAVRVARAAAAWQYLDPSRSLKKGQLQPLISHGQIVVRALSVCVCGFCAGSTAGTTAATASTAASAAADKVQ